MTLTKVRNGLMYVCLFFVLCYSAFTVAEDHRAAKSVGVIVNESVAADQLSLKDLRAIFTMKKRLWSDGAAIKVFVLADSSGLHRVFCKKVLGVFPRQLESVWYRLVYSGTGSAPVKVRSETELLEMVASTPGAIGYINTESPHEHTKIITIE